MKTLTAALFILIGNYGLSQDYRNNGECNPLKTTSEEEKSEPTISEKEIEISSLYKNVYFYYTNKLIVENELA